MPTVETVELEQEQTLEAWADAPPRDNRVADGLRQAHDPARYCPRCRELRTLREEIPFIWLDVVGLLTAALLVTHWALWGLCTPPTIPRRSA